MADNGTRLSSELTRIIECPYPASLSHLADLLAHASVLTIRACIHDRPPCAVSRLATLVYEALSLCAYAFRALSSLCQSPEFRDTFLLQNPGLLNSLLTKANASQRGFDDYAGLCVLLLSRPLPACAPLPSSVQSFFLRVFEKASQSPDVTTLKAVYSMLNGACGNLLSLLSSKRREKFDQDLSNILSCHTTGQASMLLLWCFGIALFAEHPVEAGHAQGSRSSFEQATETATAPVEKWKTAAAQKMFGSTSKMYKTIYMTYLSVIWAAKGDVGVSDDEAIEGIQIATRMIQSVDQAALQDWPKTSVLVKSTIARLPSKISRMDINPTVQLEAWGFYALVVGEGALPLEAVTQYEQCLANIACLVDADGLRETLSISLPLFFPHIQQSSVQLLISGILDACISPLNSAQLSNYTTLVEQITAALPICTSFQAKLLSASMASELQAKVWNLIQVNVETEHTVCRTYAKSTHQALVSATIAMLLALALTVQWTGSTLPLAITTALVNKQRQLTHVASQCSHVLRTPEAVTVSLFQQKHTPHTGQHLEDWRDRLKSELEGQGSYQRDSIIHSVAQICQDLETRCNNAEEPFRRERETSQQLEQRVADLTAQVTYLESEVTDGRFHLEGLEDEKLNLFDEKEKLSTKLEDLQSQFNEANWNADELARTLREDIDAKELKLRSTILAHEETTRAHHEEIKARDETLSELKKELRHVSDYQASLCEERETLQDLLNDVSQRLSSEIETVCSQSEEIAHTKDRNIELELQLQGTEADLDTITARLSELQVSHQELVQSSEEAYVDLETRYIRDMDAATASAKEDIEMLNAQLQKALQQGQRAEDVHDETRRDLQQLQTLVLTLETRIQELVDFCSEQEEELEELRALRKNVLAGLGLASQHPLAIRSTIRAQKHPADLQSSKAPREHKWLTSAVQTLVGVPRASRGVEGITSTVMENIANASFASSDSHPSQNGSTPKRSKPRSSSKVPAMRTPCTQRPILASKSVAKKLSLSKRSALRQLSPNRRHTTVGIVVSENEGANTNEMRSVRKRRGSLQGVEEADFDMEEILAGTPLTPGNFVSGTGRIPDDDDADND